MTAQPAQIDTRIEIVTPENIAFQYRIAGPFRRLPALLLDYLFRGLILAGLFWLGSLLSLFSGSMVFLVGLLCLGWFSISWFYGGLFETYWNGQTPGKRMCSLRVVGSDGQPIRGWQATLRNILREIDLLPVVPAIFLSFFIDQPLLYDSYQAILIPLGLVGFFICSTNPRFQRLGDLASGTIVIVEEQGHQAGMTMLKDHGALQAAAELPPDIRVSRRLGRALSKYVQRRLLFTPLRRAELSHRLGEPLRQRYRIRPDLTDDQLLCGLYIRTFIADSAGAEQAQQELLAAGRANWFGGARNAGNMGMNAATHFSPPAYPGREWR
jgi:uncharacterized RDD family membrane protein YckC